MTGAGLATGPVPALLGALAVLPQGARDGEGVPSLGIAFRSSPTSLSSCAHVDFSREKSGRDRGRFYSGAVFHVTLQQCLFPLGKTKWWLPERLLLCPVVTPLQTLHHGEAKRRNREG